MKTKTVETTNRILFGVALVMAVSTIASLPFAFTSVFRDLKHPDHDVLSLTPSRVAINGTYSMLDIKMTGIDEVAGTVSLQVSGYHHCAAACSEYTERVVFYQIDRDDADQDSLPPAEAVTLPSSGSEASAKITLPIRGAVLTYPFDKYTLGLGIDVERVASDKSVKILSPAETEGHLEILLDEQLSRLDLAGVERLDPKSVKPKKSDREYAYATLLHYQRPAFLKVVVFFVVLLTVGVAVYTMISRPFDQLVINAGAVILGVYGARSLILSGFPADVTLVDTIFALVVLYNMLALTVRGMNHFHMGGNLNILPWARVVPPAPAPWAETQSCPECLSKIPAAATRCAFCTSQLGA